MFKKIMVPIALLCLMSCGKMQDIKIEEFQGMELKTLKGNKAVIELSVLIDNPSAHNITIKAADIEILRDGYYFGVADLNKETKIGKRSKQTVSIFFNLEITDRIVVMSGRIRDILSGNDRTKLSFSGYIKGKAKGISKKITFENVEFIG